MIIIFVVGKEGENVYIEKEETLFDYHFRGREGGEKCIYRRRRKQRAMDGILWEPLRR